MEKLQFKIQIHAPVAKVYNTMLGIDSKETYNQWTSIFNASSTYEGSWEKGAKIAFIGISENGKREGMLGQIKENIPYRFVSIGYYGLLDGGEEITDGPIIAEWVNATENYTYEEAGNNTIVTIGIDMTDEFAEYFKEMWPLALNKLKEISEKK
jgi:hypothetical protein